MQDFEKGGGGGGARNFRKFERNIDQNLKLSHSNFVLFFAQNQVKSKKKRFSLKFRPIFRLKSGEEQKKRSSLKFRPIFRPKSSEEQKKGLHSIFIPYFAQYQVISSPKPDAQLGPWLNGPP